LIFADLFENLTLIIGVINQIKIAKSINFSSKLGEISITF